MMVLPTKRQKSPVYVCQISCPSTGIHVHALISMFGTQSFLPKKLIKRKKKTALLRIKHDFYYFPYLVIDPGVDSSI